MSLATTGLRRTLFGKVECMAWVRVKIHDTSQLAFPVECPNCMQQPAATPTPLVRSAGVPFAVSITTHGNWMFCQRCSEWHARPTRWKKWAGILPGALLAVLALYFAWSSLDNPGGMSPAAGWCLLGAIVAAIGGCTIAHLTHMFAPLPENCISNFPTVKPIRGGTAMLSRKTFAIMDFKNPLYVDALLAANPGDNVQYSDKALTKARSRFHAKWPNRGK